MRIEASLSELGGLLVRAREDLRILDEQIAFQSEVVEDAKTRMLVSETPLADREHAEAQKHVDAMTRSRSAVTASIAELELAVDDLLGRLEPQPD